MQSKTSITKRGQNKTCDGLYYEIVSDVEDAECLDGSFSEAALREPMAYIFCERKKAGFFRVVHPWAGLDDFIEKLETIEFCKKYCSRNALDINPEFKGKN